MGKLVLIAVIVVASIIAISVITVTDRSEELPETLNLNFKNLGSYALQYAVNQVIQEEVVGTTVQEFDGDDEFMVLNGQIKSIEYNFTFKDVTIGTEEETEEEDPIDQGLDFSGSLNINPSNGANEFRLVTPDGIYDRWDLHQYNIAGYNGPASEIEIKPKAQGVYLTINEETVELSKSTLYTITSENMTAHVFNSRIKRGRAMGKWWIDITAVNASIDPLPDGVEGGWSSNDEDADNTIVTQTYSLIQNVEIIADVASYVGGKYYEHTSSCYLEADTKVDFDILEDGTVVINDRVDVTFTALGAAFSNSYNQVAMEYSVDGGDNFKELWDGNYIQNGWEYTMEDVPSGAEIVLEAQWYDYYYRRYGSQRSTSSWTNVYRDGDQAPDYVPYPGQESAEAFMAPYLSASGKVTLGENDAIFLFELGHHTKDYQDGVMLVTFEKIGESETVFMGEIDLDTDQFKVIYWKP